jgi:hypothetical protein
MRLPRFRLRTLMIAVAVVGILFGSGLELHRRSVRFQALAERHGSEAHVMHIRGSNGRAGGELRVLSINDVPIDRKLADWHLELRDRYRLAAGRPWLPVPPDPPEPK